MNGLPESLSVHSTAAGCFAAGTGFLLNFTIREHPPGRKPNRSSSASASQTPLAPGQHRLTDDGEPIKLVAVTQQGRRQAPKGSKAQSGEGDQAVSHSTPREGQAASQLEDVQSVGPHGRLFQGAVAQIKVSSCSLA